MKTMINIKADKEVKENAQKIASELGLSLSAIINAYLKNFIRDREVSFSTAPRMTPYLEKVIKEVRADYKAGKNISPTFNNMQDAIDWLDSDED
jgi:addiction module RelB/DinJ family antitoxin